MATFKLYTVQGISLNVRNFNKREREVTSEVAYLLLRKASIALKEIISQTDFN